MSVQVYLPDTSTMFQGLNNFSNKNLTENDQTDDNNTADDQQDQNATSQNNDDEESPSSRANVARSLFTRQGMKEQSQKISNPFDAIGGMFQNTPLINVNTRNINIQVPFVGQEDITRYQSYLNDWMERNQQIMQDWNMA